jgi:hypothetical protein
MERLDYDDFEVVLEGHADGMTAQVATSPVGPSGRVPFVLPGVDDQSLRLLVLTLRATRSTRALDNEVTSDVRRYGEALFTALFHDESLTTLRSSLQVSSSKGHGLRIRIRYADMPALANVPWELLYDKQRRRFLCQYPMYPVVRFIDVPEDVRPLSIRGAVRMLVVISSPTELVDLDVEEEWRRLSAAVQPLIDSGQLIMDRLLVATLDAVRQAVTATDYHVFHFIGHGGFDAHTGDGTLAFTDKYGRYRPETGHDLGVILATSPIRLAVLNSCEGARVSDLDPYAGTAASLVDLGIPAVVAMQFEISDEAAIAFSAAMYTALMSGHTIDLAVTLARQAILTTSRSEWATPVLYLRAPEGVLFDFGREAIPLEELTHVLPAVVADAEEASGADLDVPHTVPPAGVTTEEENGPPSAPPPTFWERWRKPLLAAILAVLIAGGIAWVAAANPFGGSAVPTSASPTDAPTPTPTPTPSPAPSPSPPSESSPPPQPTSAPPGHPGTTKPSDPPPPKPDIGVRLTSRTRSPDGTTQSVVFTVANGGKAPAATSTLTITVSSSGVLKSPPKGCTTAGLTMSCGLKTLASQGSVPFTLVVVNPSPGKSFSITASVGPPDGGATEQATATVGCLDKGLPCQVIVDPNQGPLAPGGSAPKAAAG